MSVRITERGAKMSVQFVTLPDGTVLVNATIPEGTSDAVEGGTVTILGTLVNSGEVEIVPGVTYNGTTDITSPGVLDFGSPVTELENTGLIAFYDAVFADTSGVSGQQTVIANDGTIEGSGTLALAGGKPLSINNTITGTIEANLNSTLTIDTNGGTLVNAGVITNASTYVYQYQYNAYVDVEGLGVTIADTKIINTGTINGAGYNESFLTAGADVVGGVLGSGNLYVSGSATLDGQSSSPVTLAFFDTLIVDNGGSLSLLGTIDLAGHLDDSSSGRNTDIVLATPTVTLTGTGEISLSDQIGNRIYGATGATTLINGVLIAGAGAIEANATGPLTIDNQAAGTIAATTANALVIDTAGAQLANAGLLLATGQGGLRLFSTPLYLLPSGTIEAAAGSLLFSDSSLANDVGGTLTGGTYMAGTYENSYSAVYPQDDTALPTGPGNGTLDIQGGAAVTTLDANVTLDGPGSVFKAGGVELQKSLTWIGDGGTLSLLDGLDETFASPLAVAAGGSLDVKGGRVTTPGLTIAAGARVSAFGNIDGPVSNNGTIVLDDQSNAGLNIDTGGPALMNAGLIEDIGNSGELAIGSVLDSTGTLLTTANRVILQSGGVFTGGVLAGSNRVESQGAVTLDGSTTPVTIGKGVDLFIDNGNVATLLGTIDFDGTLHSDSNPLNTDVILATPTVTLTGSGTLDLSGSPNNRIYGASAADGTLVSDVVIQGAGQLGLGTAANTLSLVNSGTVLADQSGIAVQNAAITNSGLLEASGAALAFSGSTLDNTGTVEAAPGGTVSFDALTHVTNLANGTLTGGTWIADAGPAGYAGITFESQAITEIATTVTLDGAGAVLVSEGGALGQTLGRIAAGGTLALLGGLSEAFQGSVTIASGGSLTLGGGTLTAGGLLLSAGAQVSGTGAVEGSVTDDGLVLASGGALRFGPGLGGTGTVQIGPDSLVELSNAFTGTVDFTPGSVGTLALNGPQDAPALIMGLASGDTLDLLNTPGASAVLNGPTLDVTAAGTVYAYELAAAVSGVSIAARPDAAGTGTNLVFGPESATVAQPLVATPIDVAAFRAGSSGSGQVILENNAAAGAGSLAATVAGTGPGLTASGSVAGLAPGASSNGIAVSLTSNTAGLASGALTLDFASTGSGGPVNLPSQTYTVQGAAYRLASGKATVPLLVTEVIGQGSLDIPITITNTAAADGYSEQLIATGVNDPNATLEATGATAAIAAGQSDTVDIAVTINPYDGLDTAGTVTGDVTIDLQSVGTGTDGAAAADLGNVVVPVTISLLNPAQPEIIETSGPGAVYNSFNFVYVDLGTHPQSDQPILLEFGVQNIAPLPAVPLNGQLTSLSAINPGAFTASGPLSVGNLMAGQTANLIDLAFNPGTIGTSNTEYVFSPTDATGPNASAFAQVTLDVTGTVDAATTLAAAVINTPTLVGFGNVHQNDTDQQQISISNTASPPAGSAYPAEALDTTIQTSGNVNYLGSNTVLGLGAGATNADAFLIGLDTSNPGVVGGAATLDFTSDGKGIDTDNTTPLTPGTITVTGTVYDLASANIGASPTIVHVGDRSEQFFTVNNNSGAGAYSENLIATAVGASGGLDSVAGSTGPIADGGTNATSVSFVENTQTAGYDSGYATFNVVSDGTGIDGLGKTTLQPDSVFVPFQVNNYATAEVAIAAGLGATLSHVGNTYTLDLGTIALDSSADTVSLQVENTGSGPADTLDGTFSGAGGDGITVSGFPNTFSLSPQASQSGYEVVLDPTNAGTFETTLTLNATSDNANSSSPLDAQTVTVIGTVLAEAIADIAPGTIDLGAVRVNDPVSPKALTISNTQTEPAQMLDVTATGANGATVTNGSITGLLPSSGANSSIMVSATDSQPGLIGGSVMFDLESDDGMGHLTQLFSQETPVSVTGTVYALAKPSVSPPAQTYYRVGDLNNTGSILVANAQSPYAEVLDASVSGSGGGVTSTGTVTNVAPGSSSPLAYTVDTSNAGTVAGTIDLAYSSDGTGLDGAGITADGTGSVTINATVDNLATVTLSSVPGADPEAELTQTGANSWDYFIGATSLDGPSIIANLSVLNGASGPADGLSGTWTLEPPGTIGEDVGFTNALSPLVNVTAGASLAQSFTLAATSTGLQNETLVFTPTSVNPSESAMPLSPITVTVDGYVGNVSPTAVSPPTQPGAPSIPNPPPSVTPGAPPSAPPTVPPAQPVRTQYGTADVGTLRVGEIKTVNVGFQNTAASGAAGLNVTINPKETQGSITATGSISNLGPGQTDTMDIEAGVDTSKPGVVNGNFQVDYTSSTSGLNTATSLVTFNADPNEAAFPLTGTLFSVDTGQVGGNLPTTITGPLAINGNITAAASFAVTGTIAGGAGQIALSDPVSINVSDPTSVNTGKTFTVQTTVAGNNNASLSPVLPALTGSLNLDDTITTSGSLDVYTPLSLLSLSPILQVPLNYNLSNPVSLFSSGVSPSYTYSLPGPPGSGLTVALPTGYDSSSANQATSSTPPSPVAGLNDIVQNEVTTPIFSVSSPNLLGIIPPVLAADTAISKAVSVIPGNNQITLVSVNATGNVVIASQTVFVPTELDVTLTPSWGAASGPVAVGTPITLTAPSSPGSYTISASYSLMGTLVTMYGFSANLGLKFSLLGATLAYGTVNIGPLFSTGLTGGVPPGTLPFQYTSPTATITATATGTMASTGATSQINPVYTLNVVSPGASTGSSSGSSGSGPTSPASSPLDIIPVSGTVDQLALPLLSADAGDLSSPNVSAGPSPNDGSGTPSVTYDTNYTLNLGSTMVGESLGANLSVLNAAQNNLPADLLNGVWLFQSGDASVFSNSLGYDAKIAAGASGDITGITASSAKQGTFNETLSYTPASNNSDESPLGLKTIRVEVIASFTMQPPPPPLLYLLRRDTFRLPGLGRVHARQECRLYLAGPDRTGGRRSQPAGLCVLHRRGRAFARAERQGDVRLLPLHAALYRRCPGRPAAGPIRHH